jgi:hypothetical protein
MRPRHKTDFSVEQEVYASVKFGTLNEDAVFY